MTDGTLEAVGPGEHDANGVEPGPDAEPAAEGAPPPGELTEAQLEALLKIVRDQ